MRRPVAQVLDAQRLEQVLHGVPDPVMGEPELQRPKGNLIPHGRGKELHVRVLKHEAHLLPELTGKGPVFQRRFGQRPAEDMDRPRLREDQPVEQGKERGLAGAVRAQNDHALSLTNGDSHVPERGRGPGVGITDIVQAEQGRHNRILLSNSSIITPKATVVTTQR